MLKDLLPRAARIGAWSAMILAAWVHLTTASAQTPGNSAGTWEIDTAASEVHWRIYKAGAFARFGHNHVVAIAEPSGTIEVAANIADSRFEMRFAVGELSIDDAELRGRYGEDFESEPSDEDVDGTRDNMLTEQVLNGDVYPEIFVVGTQLSGVGEDQSIELSIEMLGRTVSLTVPVNVSFGAQTLRAQANFRIQHEDLGMEPFSVMMGALQVAPEIDFTVDIRAVRRVGEAPAQVL